MPTTRPLVLLVEGRDDKHVVIQICARIGFQPEFYIKDTEGIDKLLEQLSVEIKAPGLQSLGILVDANDDSNGRWQAISDRLKQQGVELDEQPAPTGAVIDGTPRIGVWLMPDNQTSGELENFIAGMIPADDPVWPLSAAYVDGIPQDDRKFIPSKIIKAKVHAWLATRRDPRPMGLAIRANDLDICVPPTQTFIKWLHDLFG